MNNPPRKSFFLISQVFFPDEVSTANLFTQLCVKIAEDKEFKVMVWCAQPSYNFHKRQPRGLLHKNVEIIFLPSTNFHKEKVVGRLINYFSFAFSVIVKLLFTNDKTPVFTHTTPPSLGIFIALICRIKKRTFNYILLDIFPDGLIRLGKLRKKSLFVKIWQSTHLSALKRSSRIIVIGRDMQNWLFNFYPESTVKTQLINLWQDETLIQPKDFSSNPFILKHRMNDKFVVQYSGNMGLWTELRTLGETVNMNPEKVLFCFIGGGMRKKELVDFFNDKIPANVIMFPFLSNNDYADSVTACHVACVTLQRNLEGIAVPSKIYGIMAAGIPVIGIVPKMSEISLIIEEEKCGLVIEPGDKKALVEAIQYLKNNTSTREEMGKRGREAFLRKYSLTKIAEEYKEIIL